MKYTQEMCPGIDKHYIDLANRSVFEMPDNWALVMWSRAHDRCLLGTLIKQYPNGMQKTCHGKFWYLDRHRMGIYQCDDA